ncbi:MAG: hypothetical protein R2822_27745 [Spirosomataceae bacterium]
MKNIIKFLLVCIWIGLGACPKENNLNANNRVVLKDDSTGIPQNIGIFCPINKDAQRDATEKFPTNIEKWYQEVGG